MSHWTRACSRVNICRAVDPVMRIRINKTAGISALLLMSAMQADLQAGPLNLSTELMFEQAHATRSGTVHKLNLSIVNKLDAELSDDLGLHGNLRFNHDRRDSNDYSQERSYGRYSRPHYIGQQGKLTLQELYLDWQMGSGLLRLGKQQVAWGETDGMRVLDLVNPLDLSEFVLAPFDEIRIPVWMLNYSWIGEEYAYQFLFIPDTTRSYVPNGRFQPSSPLVTPVLAPSQAAGAQVPVIYPDPGGRSGLKHADLGLRLGRSLAGRDLNLILLRQQSHEYLAVASLDATGQIRTLTPTYFMRHLAGVSYSEALDEFVFRAELSYSPREYFYQRIPGRGSGLNRRAEWRYAAALDWYGMDDGLLSMQLLQSVLAGSATALVRDRVDTSLSLALSQNFLNQIYRLDLSLIHSLNQKDGLLRASVLWNTTDHLSISLGVDSFYGEATGLFGQFRERDRVSLIMKYAF